MERTDRTAGSPEKSSSSQHIWLRHAIQFTENDCTHTIEIGIPMPIGSSADTREQLIREANAGMEQLSQHIERRAGMLQQTYHSAPTPPLPPPETAQEPADQSQSVIVPPTRTHVAASMPTTPRMPSDTNGNISLPQFLQCIKEGLELTPKQAMELLKVKTLSGLNLRDALERLQHLIAQDPPLPPPVSSLTQEPAPASPKGEKPTAANVPQKERSAQTFDEEVDLEEGEKQAQSQQFSEDERSLATSVLKRLREAQGNIVASMGRLGVLRNVLDSQVSNRQLQQLMHAVWRTHDAKKLKADQVEALIYWAKTDDFVREMELVLAVIQEGQ